MLLWNEVTWNPLTGSVAGATLPRHGGVWRQQFVMSPSGSALSWMAETRAYMSLRMSVSRFMTSKKEVSRTLAVVADGPSTFEGNPWLNTTRHQQPQPTVSPTYSRIPGHFRLQHTLFGQAPSGLGNQTHRLTRWWSTSSTSSHRLHVHGEME